MAEQDSLPLAPRLPMDFLGLAACELWRRWLPERPSTEMLDDWMQEGYRLRDEQRSVEACDRWWQLWCALRARFTSEMRTPDDTAAVFDGLQYLTNWVQDLEEELTRLALRDRRYAEHGRELCEGWLAQFPDDSDSMLFNFRRALALFQARLGHAAEAAQILDENIERWPEDPWTYIAAADVYSGFFNDFGGAMKDRGKAVALLKQGMARVPKDAQDYGELKERLKERLKGLPSR